MGIVDILFPKFCLGCGKGREYLCSSCVSKVSYAQTICPVCRRFSLYGKTHDACLSDTSLSGLVSLWEYSGIVRKSINDLKFKYAFEIANDLGKRASIEVKKFHLKEHTAMVPIPLHKTRNNWRGFNQAERIGMVIARELQWLLLPSLLHRNTSSKQQALLPMRKRVRNIRGKIAVNRPVFDTIPQNTAFVLIDDVWTTGSTMKEACRVLRLCGAKEVWGLTIARA